jgi:hypothetical protein
VGIEISEVNAGIDIAPPVLSSDFLVTDWNAAKAGENSES